MDRHHRLLYTAALLLLLAPAAGGMGAATTAVASPAGAPALVDPFAHPSFQRTWNRTDRPVSSGQVARSWYWGPNPNTPGVLEDYLEGVGGKRLVQYFDKSRMEINNPAGNPDDPFFVTNGLLTVELISGKMQVGNAAYENRIPADIALASDTDDPNAPTYASFQGVANTPLGDHPAGDKTGQFATATINRAGQVGNDAAMANFPGTKFVHFEGITKHNVPEIVWNFLNLTGPVYDPATGQNVNARLSDPWFYATGLPISEPYWAKVKIANQPNQDVMIQAFERRVVTYVPNAPEGFKVQMGNIGQHYYDWRYKNAAPPPTAVVPTPTNTPPIPMPTATTPGPGHTTAQWAGTWLNEDMSVGSVGKVWITRVGVNDLKIQWFGVCSPGFCENETKTVPYNAEPLVVTLDGRTFSFTLNADASKLLLKYTTGGNTQNHSFERANVGDYVGTWLNDDAGTGGVAKVWIKNGGGGNIFVQWFGACGGSLCVNEAKTIPFTFEPITVTLNGKPMVFSLDSVKRDKLKLDYSGATHRMHKVKITDYNGSWNNVDPNTGDIVKIIITNTGNNLNIHWFGACSPNPCDNGTTSGPYTGEPFVLNLSGRTFTITFDNAGATRLRVEVTNAPGGPRTNILKR